MIKVSAPMHRDADEANPPVRTARFDQKHRNARQHPEDRRRNRSGQLGQPAFSGL